MSVPQKIYVRLAETARIGSHGGRECILASIYHKLSNAIQKNKRKKKKKNLAKNKKKEEI